MILTQDFVNGIVILERDKHKSSSFSGRLVHGDVDRFNFTELREILFEMVLGHLVFYASNKQLKLANKQIVICFTTRGTPCLHTARQLVEIKFL